MITLLLVIILMCKFAKEILYACSQIKCISTKEDYAVYKETERNLGTQDVAFFLGLQVPKISIGPIYVDMDERAIQEKNPSGKGDSSLMNCTFSNSSRD